MRDPFNPISQTEIEHTGQTMFGCILIVFNLTICSSAFLIVFMSEGEREREKREKREREKREKREIRERQERDKRET